MTDPDPDAADVIAAALARLRGRRGHRPESGRDGAGPWRGGAPRGGGAPWGGGAPRTGGAPGEPDRGGSRGRGRGHDHHDARAHGRQGIPDPFGSHGSIPPGAPWSGAHGRFAGPARMRLLETLAAASTPLSVSELAERIGVDQPRASRLVQQCVGLGLVRREADPDDARRTRIVLTDDGTRIVSGFRGNRRAMIEDALADFTETEQSELARLLTKLADAWGR